jgi:osmotically inducible lipoprotein OsmB
MRIIAMALAIAGTALASGCGSTTEDRALSGAGIGAVAGGVGGALTGNTLGGAVLGGAAGAATGALTDEEDVDLGDPIWK